MGPTGATGPTGAAGEVTDAYSVTIPRKMSSLATMSLSTIKPPLWGSTSQSNPDTFVLGQPGWYSVTYDLEVRPGPSISEYWTLGLTGGTTSGAQEPFAPQSELSSVSDTQLVDCTAGACQLNVQLGLSAPFIIELQYADVTITQVNTSP